MHGEVGAVKRAEVVRRTDLVPRSIPGFPTLRPKLGPSGDTVVFHEMQSNALCDVARGDAQSRRCGGLPSRPATFGKKPGVSSIMFRII